MGRLPWWTLPAVCIPAGLGIWHARATFDERLAAMSQQSPTVRLAEASELTWMPSFEGWPPGAGIEVACHVHDRDGYLLDAAEAWELGIRLDSNPPLPELEDPERGFYGSTVSAVLDSPYPEGTDFVVRWDPGAPHNEAAWASRLLPALVDWFPGSP